MARIAKGCCWGSSMSRRLRDTHPRAIFKLKELEPKKTCGTYRTSSRGNMLILDSSCRNRPVCLGIRQSRTRPQKDKLLTRVDTTDEVSDHGCPNVQHQLGLAKIKHVGTNRGVRNQVFPVSERSVESCLDWYQSASSRGGRTMKKPTGPTSSLQHSWL